MDELQINTTDKQQYFYVGIFKFCLMFLCTFGFYLLYWFYKNWRYIKERDGLEISPVWRSIFSYFWYYSLIDDVSENSGSRVTFNEATKMFLAILYFLIGFCGYFIPDNYWYVAFLVILPLLPLVVAIKKINTALMIKGNLNPHTFGNYLTYLIGGTLIVGTIFTLGFMPSTSVIDGSELSNSQMSFLKNQQLIYEDEQVIFFYSAGVFSIKDDGQFITDQHIVTYRQAFDKDVLYRGTVAYEHIVDVSTQWSRSVMEDTIVIVTDIDGDEFDLWLSSDNGGDRLFVRELLVRWNKVKKEASSER